MEGLPEFKKLPLDLGTPTKRLTSSRCAALDAKLGFIDFAPRPLLLCVMACFTRPRGFANPAPRPGLEYRLL